jgi:hypothetical protein
MRTNFWTIGVAGACLATQWSLAAADLDLERNFTTPPASARPWVYWFPLDGNISSNGITLDLEAMKRVGVGGVLYMETDQGAPRGPAKFAGPLWRDLFKHICTEAHRLGIEVNMNNDAGWCGSGGPWITPELSMQRIIWSQTNVAGPRHFAAVLPQAKANARPRSHTPSPICAASRPARARKSPCAARTRKPPPGQPCRARNWWN